MTSRCPELCQPEAVATFVIGSPDTDYVRADVWRRAYPDTEPEWLDVEIDISSGPFSARYRATWRAGFLPPFRRQVEALYETLEGTAVLEPDWERSLSLTLSGDGLGHVRITGEASVDRGPLGATLTFALPDVDQTYLPALIEELKAIEAEFPTTALP